MKKSLLLLTLLFMSSAVAADQTYSGVYTYSKDGHTFQHCGGEKVYWLDATPLVVKPLKDFYSSEPREKGTKLYVTLRGHEHFEESTKPANEYDGIYHVSEVYLFSSIVPDSCLVTDTNTSKETN